MTNFEKRYVCQDSNSWLYVSSTGIHWIGSGKESGIEDAKLMIKSIKADVKVDQQKILYLEEAIKIYRNKFISRKVFR